MIASLFLSSFFRWFWSPFSRSFYLWETDDEQINCGQWNCITYLFVWNGICFFLFHFRDFGGPFESSDGRWEKEKHRFEFQKGSILYPPKGDGIKKKVWTAFHMHWDESVNHHYNVFLQIKRLHLLLTESSVDVPSNLEARRRITFFTNSLFMQMPQPPRIQDVLSFRWVFKLAQ